MNRPPSSVQRSQRWKTSQAPKNYLLLNLQSKFDEAKRLNDAAEDKLASDILKDIIRQISSLEENHVSDEMKELRVKANYLLADLEEHEIA